jgi:hypothetical protein
MSLLLSLAITPIYPWFFIVGACFVFEVILHQWRDFLLHDTTSHGYLKRIRQETGAHWCCLLHGVLLPVRRNFLLHYASFVIYLRVR